MSRHWKIVILMDVRVPKLELPAFRKHVQVIAEKANFLEANKTIIQQMRVQINKKFKQASEYMDTLRIKKRGLVSTVSIEDQKFYNKKVEYLKLSEDGVMVDVEKSVLMLNSTMKNLCESQAGKDQELLGNLSKLLSIAEDSAEITGSEFEAGFETLMKLFDLRLDEYIMAAQAIVKISLRQ